MGTTIQLTKAPSALIQLCLASQLVVCFFAYFLHAPGLVGHLDSGVDGLCQYRHGCKMDLLDPLQLGFCWSRYPPDLNEQHTVVKQLVAALAIQRSALGRSYVEVRALTSNGMAQACTTSLSTRGSHCPW